MILSFLSAYCFLLWPAALWELNQWMGRLLSQPLAWIGILISIHYYPRITTPSPSCVWHSPRQMKNAHSPCALMCFSMHAISFRFHGNRQCQLDNPIVIFISLIRILDIDKCIYDYVNLQVMMRIVSDWHFSIPLLLHFIISISSSSVGYQHCSTLIGCSRFLVLISTVNFNIWIACVVKLCL